MFVYSKEVKNKLDNAGVDRKKIYKSIFKIIAHNPQIKRMEINVVRNSNEDDVVKITLETFDKLD
jgi:hypothetical protein